MIVARAGADREAHRRVARQDAGETSRRRLRGAGETPAARPARNQAGETVMPPSPVEILTWRGDCESWCTAGSISLLPVPVDASMA